MAEVRGHKDLPLGPFKGLWRRGDQKNTPLDHFENCNNIVAIGEDWETRRGIGISQTVAAPIKNIKRAYNYPTLTANTQIILVENSSGQGEIYHLVNESTVYGPLLTKTGMVDFAFVPYAGRGYISPIGNFTVGDLNIQKGLQNEFLYVYLGDGTAARKAAGIGPTDTPLTIANGAAGHTDAGFHLFGTVFEYNTGYLSPIKQITGFNTSALSSVSFAAIQTSGDANVVRVHLVATLKIDSYNGNTTGYQFFFIPDATVNNGTLVLNNVSFFDSELEDDASHLLDNYTEIPAGAGLSIYHDRLVLNTTYDDINLLLISAPGEPEAIDQINGIISVPPDANPVTQTFELRDVLYYGKRSKTGAYTDNGDEPATWPYTGIDDSLGFPIHGVATVIDSGSKGLDYAIIGNFAGVYLFNGKYVGPPELSYKIQDVWKEQIRNNFRLLQLLNIPINQEFYVVLPDGRLAIANYSEGLDFKNIKWSVLSFYVTVNSILAVNIDDIVVCMDNPNLGVPDI